ncbi:MAG TPA: tetratricopeptide repeat protein, partial [Pseudonocardia sp.]|nr:tetratricopeptide repeat protein [Pseudonocardia sp.]
AVPAGPLSAEGRALLDADRPRAAVEVLRRAVAAGEPSAEDLLARAYLDSGSWQEAVDRLAPLVEQGEVRFAGRLGVALAGLGDAVRAEEALRLAVESGEVAASNDLAILLRDRGRLAEAVATLLPLADAGDGQAAANLVALTLEEGDLAGAIAHAERYADERRPDTLVALAEVRAAQGRADEAETLHRRACELGALRAHTAYGTFLLLVRLEPEEAEREYLEARRLREPGWAWTLGRFLLDQGRPDEARDHLEHAAARGDRAAEQALVELDGEDEDD